MSSCHLVVVVLMTTLAVGCGGSRSGADYSGVTLAEVRGRVTLDGKPLARAEVLLIAADDSWSAGLTDSAGRYRLQFDSHRTGTPLGPKVVRIHTRPVTVDASGQLQESEGLDNGAAADPLPARYNTRSTLTVDITGPAENLDFDLVSTLSDG